MSRYFMLLDSASNQLYQQLIRRESLQKLESDQEAANSKTPKHLAHPDASTPPNPACAAIGSFAADWEVDFESINALLPNQDTALKALLEPLSAKLIEAGATRVLVPNITLSLVLRRLELLEGQLIDPIKLLQDYLGASINQRPQRFRVYGGKHTAKSLVWNQATLQNTWSFCPSSAAVTERVDQIRRITLSKPASDLKWTQTAADELACMMREDEASLAVLACSELSQIFHDQPTQFSGLPVIDLANLQAAAFVR